MNDYHTTGSIASELGVDRDQVTYAIRKAKIKPIGTAGIARLFDSKAMGQVREFLATKRKRSEETAT